MSKKPRIRESESLFASLTAPAKAPVGPDPELANKKCFVCGWPVASFGKGPPGSRVFACFKHRGEL